VEEFLMGLNFYSPLRSATVANRWPLARASLQ